MPRDWLAWHEGYSDPCSPLAQRLVVVQRMIERALDSFSHDTVRILSLCAGDGRDLLPVLARSRKRRRVCARLIEREPRLAERARALASQNGLGSVDVVCGDAALTDDYRDAVPADLVLVCGIFGNVSDEDVHRTVAATPQLCDEHGLVIWTRGRRHPDLTPTIRGWFAAAGFVERAFESPGPGSYAVGMEELRDAPSSLEPGQRLFEFVR